MNKPYHGFDQGARKNFAILVLKGLRDSRIPVRDTFIESLTPNHNHCFLGRTSP